MQNTQAADSNAAAASTPEKARPHDVAIVGIGCRFPGDANDPKRLWDNLIAGLDAISETPEERWAIGNFFHPRKGASAKSATKWGGFVNDIDRFDAEFFGISPREARLMDPQQRMLLEVCWEALEDAGCVPSQWHGRGVGVYVGGFTLDYMLMQLGGADYRSVEPHTATGSMMTLLANRLSYLFGFNGPSLAVDTACSSSLVAVHLACRSLAAGESEMAIAGGVNALLTPSYTIAESRAGMLSPTGRSKAFDSRADGYVRGEGAGLVVLKTIARAQADGDHIYAVIRATAVNQDGRSEGLTVPSGSAQMALMRTALAQAAVAPHQLHYVEAHGTGTPVGDPIEANAIGQVAREGRGEGQRCLIGSIKTNFGHTEAAAGVAGLIKAALVLSQRCVPPHLHLQRPNPKIDFAALALEAPADATALPSAGTLYSAVNSFGFGGTNAHAILASADALPTMPNAAPQAAPQAAPPAWVLPVSARSPKALAEAAGRLAQALSDGLGAPGSGSSVRDVCETAAMRREQHPHRACVIGADAAELIAALKQLAAGESHSNLLVGPRPVLDAAPLSFVYSGMGPQWWGMGQRLYATEPVFAETVDRCVALFDALAGWSLFDAMSADEGSSRMAETEVAQPAGFVVQVALTELMASWGIRPHAIVGHSAGEPAAAYAAGVLSLEDAVRTIYVRSHLQQTTAGMGCLLAVGLSREVALAQLAMLGESSLSLAAINSPSAVTVAGDGAAIERLKDMLDAQSIFARALRVSVPYHSVYMEPLQAPLLAALADLSPRSATVALYSTVLGRRIDGPEMDAAYWYRNVRQPVEFLAALKAMADDGLATFVEVGPHPVLAGSIRELYTLRGQDCDVTHTLNRASDEPREARRLIAALHVLGHSPDWRAAQGQGAWTRLPTYAWRNSRFWAETPASRRSRLQPPEHALLARRIDAATPSWEVDLEAPQLGFLEDHQIQGVVVFPGAGYMEMVMHAARSLYGGLDAVALEQVAFVKALYLSPEQPVTLRLAIEPATHTYSITSRVHADEAASWQTHCTGRLRVSQSPRHAPIDIAALQAQCPIEVARAACYQHFRALGLEYGETFQGIARLWQGEAQAVALLDVPAELQLTLGDFNAHPAVLDVCFQTLAAALPMKREGSVVYMPTGIGEGRVHRPFTPRMWIHARITAQDALGMTGDIEVYDEAGERVVEIRDCRARAMGAEGASAPSIGAPQKLYRPDWVVQPRAEPEALAAAGRIGTWLVFGAAEALAAATIAALRSAGCTPVRVLPNSGQGAAASSETLHVDATDQASWADVLRQAGAAGNLRGVVHLGADGVAGDVIDAARARCVDGAAIDAAIARSCLVTLALGKALANAGAAEPARLWIVTRGTQQVAAHAPTHPLDAAVWGMGRVLGHGEHIDLWGGLIDLPHTPGATDAVAALEGTLIAAELTHGDGEDQIAWRDGQRHVMRVHECAPDAALPSAPVFRANASYLLTGGLGALGLVVARWMVERGARHLVLVGREGLPPRETWQHADHPKATRERIAAVRAIEAAGASVRIEPLDVADLSALQALLARHDAAGYPPLCGVIHAAGVALPQLLAQTSAQDFSAVLPAKLQGAWNLHRAFEGRTLDFFTLFSSVASVVISMGQGNYAAANAGLDALAHWRRAEGLPAVSINWGPWGDVGMATQLDLLKYFHSRGFFPMTAVQGCHALGQLMSGRTGQAVVLGAHWKTVGDTSPLGIAAPMLEHAIRDEALGSQGEVQTSAPGRSFIAEYRACDAPQERRAVLSQHLRRLACQVLRIDEAALAAGDTLTSRGMDSMMAIELKNRIEQSLKVRVAIVDLLKGASADAIAAMVGAELDAMCSAGTGAAEGALADIVDAMSDLSPEQIEALLAEAATEEEIK
jgi:acyl transferase domain-containing protein/acyl carrier protein